MAQLFLRVMVINFPISFGRDAAAQLSVGEMLPPNFLEV